MRSTMFVLLSTVIHGAAVVALALHPFRKVEPDPGAEIEVQLGETSETPGIEDAQIQTDVLPPEKEAQAAPPAQQPVEPPVVEKSVVEKVEEKKKEDKKVAVVSPAAPTPKPAPQPPPKAKSKPKKAVVAPVAPVPVAKDEPDESSQVNDDPQSTNPKDLDSELENSQEVAATPPAPKSAAEPELVPVPARESVATSAASAEDQATEADSRDVRTAVDPSPVGVSEEPVAKSAPTAGGATQKGAVSYLTLKQMSGNKAPIYPLQARKERREGRVELLYQVTQEGGVKNVQVAKSSGHADLDQEAVRAISRFRFVPGQEGWAYHPVTFALSGPEQALPSRLRSASTRSQTE
ncbi:MAG: TonB family protein [Bdellovibrionales bacterium]